MGRRMEVGVGSTRKWARMRGGIESEESLGGWMGEERGGGGGIACECAFERASFRLCNCVVGRRAVTSDLFGRLLDIESMK